MRKPPLPTETLSQAKSLRQNMTEAEKKLWLLLKDRQFENLKFRRQHPIPPYIADFFCEKLNLIIERDGGQHNSKNDAARTKFLADQGYKIIRFWNNDVLNNTEGVLIQLKENL